jgi:hypothetical protein
MLEGDRVRLDGHRVTFDCHRVLALMATESCNKLGGRWVGLEGN